MTGTAPPRPELSLGKKLGFSAVMVVVLLLMAEAAMAWLPWQRLIARDHAVGSGVQTVILSVGDSVTYGDGVEAHEAFPNRLKAALEVRGVDGVDVVNAGEQGADAHRAADLLQRSLQAMPQGTRPIVTWLVGHNSFIQYQWRQAKAPRTGAGGGSEESSGWTPRLFKVLLWSWGAAAEEVPPVELDPRALAAYRQRFEGMARLVANRGGQFYAMTYLVPGAPTADMEPYQQAAFGANRAVDLKLNAVVRELAQEYDVPLIDLERRIRVPPDWDAEWFLDPIHPTPHGHQAIADTLREALVLDGALPQEAL